MKQTQYLTQFVIMMVLVLGITSTALVLENNLTAEKGKKKAAAGAPVAVQALAYISCKGKAKCMAVSIKKAKCGGLAKFNIKAVQAVAKAFAGAAKKKSVKGMKAAAASFKKLMAPIVKCSLTPKSMKAAFKRGFKIAGGKAKAKKVKKALKKVNKAKKAKKAGKKAAKKAKKAAKKAKKAAKKAVKKAKKGKSAKKAIKKAKKAIKKAGKKAKKAGKKAAKKVKKAGKKVAKRVKMAAYILLAKALQALMKLC